MKERKEKLIEIRANNKLIGIKINKTEWKKLISSVIEFILVSSIIVSIILILMSLIGMLRNQNVDGNPLVVFISCWTWIGLVWLYSYIVNKPMKKRNK